MIAAIDRQLGTLALVLDRTPLCCPTRDTPGRGISHVPSSSDRPVRGCRAGAPLRMPGFWRRELQQWGRLLLPTLLAPRHRGLRWSSDGLACPRPGRHLLRGRTLAGRPGDYQRRDHAVPGIAWDAARASCGYPARHSCPSNWLHPSTRRDVARPNHAAATPGACSSAARVGNSGAGIAFSATQIIWIKCQGGSGSLPPCLLRGSQ